MARYAFWDYKSGNVRIRVSNIKNYGITQKEFPYEKLFIRKKVIKDKWYKKLLYSDYTYEWCGDAIYCDKDRYNDLKAVNKRDQHTEYPWRASWDGICSTYIKYTDGDGIICESDTILTSDKIDDDPPYINKKIDCLYITTYQGDNFVFRSDICGFDILKGLDEIDRTFL